MARAYNIFFGMDHIEDVASCFDDCAAKKFPKILMGNGACNSLFDPTYAPPGEHTAFWWPFAPYSVDGSPQEWENRKQYTARCSISGGIRRNLDGDNLIGTYLFTPRDLERLNLNMVQGAVRMGAYVPNQLGINRPHPLMPGSRTPVEGLYCAARRRAMAAASMARRAISRRMRLPMISSSSGRGRRCRSRSGGIDYL